MFTPAGGKTDSRQIFMGQSEGIPRTPHDVEHILLPHFPKSHKTVLGGYYFHLHSSGTQLTNNVIIYMNTWNFSQYTNWFVFVHNATSTTQRNLQLSDGKLYPAPKLLEVEHRYVKDVQAIYWDLCGIRRRLAFAVNLLSLTNV